MATYTYRSGVAPTAVDSLTEAAREESTATAPRIQGSAFSQINEIRPTIAWTSDTNADEYIGVIVLDGTAILGARQEFPAFGYGALGSGATITAFPIVMNNLVQRVEVQSVGKGDFGFYTVQHGDTVAIGFSGFGISYT